MKFARYLEETQTPEWKRAYIDYRGLKKRITAIRREQQGLGVPNSGEDHLLSSDSPGHHTPNDSGSDSAGPSDHETLTDKRRSAAGPSRVDANMSVESLSSVPEAGTSSSLDHDAREALYGDGNLHERKKSEVPVLEEASRAPPADRFISTEDPATGSEDPPYAPKTQGLPALNMAVPHAQPRTTESGAGNESRESFASRFRRSMSSPLVTSPPSSPTVGSPPSSRPPIASRPRSGTLQSIMAGLRRRSRTNVNAGGNPEAGDDKSIRGSLRRAGSWLYSQETPTRTRRFTMRDPPAPPSLAVLLPSLTPTQRKFFDKLDAELNKIENFYLDREKEFTARSVALKEQLQELKDHRKLFYAAHPVDARPWIERLAPNLAFASMLGKLRSEAAEDARASNNVQVATASAVVRGRYNKAVGKAESSWSRARKAGKSKSIEGKDGEEGGDEAGDADGFSTLRSLKVPGLDGLLKPDMGNKDRGKSKAPKYDPDYYKHAQKKLKKAVLEHYRGLELLNDYRILNLTGFRKALKKFEKVSHLQAQQAYIKERVEPSAFASGDTIQAMIKDMEELFAARFARGDKKKAMNRLRGGLRANKTHHFSTFRSGYMLGLALPALVSGIFQSFQPEVRAAIPAWPALLTVYGVFLVPTVFACLIALNIAVWANSRINYVFIFELDVRTKIDHREAMELPCFFMFTLCYAFWLSFSRIGTSHVASTSWPAIWLLIIAVFVFNPLPILAKPARYWFLRIMRRLLMPGTRRVEFSDFWMGDQFCSLAFALSNLYFVGCVYHRKFDASWPLCQDYNIPSVWAGPFVLASLPLFVRFVQSVKRYVDSRLVTHLINGGKYASGIVAYGFYYNWRRHGTSRGGSTFVLYIIFQTMYTLYAGGWDLLMDWSFLRPRARYPFLRQELLWSDKIPLYYIAIISNMLARFIWIMYLPASGPSMMTRTFIAALIEIVRRWQWNFYRLENEHLGNIDQYRVTREVPLPYRLDEMGHESDEGDEDDHHSGKKWGRRSGSRELPPPVEIDA